MRSAFWAALLFCAAASAEDQSPIPPQLSHCTVPVWQAADNDLTLGAKKRQPGKSVALPAPVAEALGTQTEWLTRYSRERRDTVDSAGYLSKMTCKDVFPAATLITLPDGLKLYAVQAYSVPGGDWLLLFVYNPASGHVSLKPALILTKWAAVGDPLLKKPYISTTDLRGDGHYQIIAEERGHNGTLYNAAVYRYFDIGPNLELTNILAFDARTMDPMDSDAILSRKLTRIDGQHLRLDLTYYPGKGKTPRNGGYAILESEGLGHPYHVKERHGTKASAPHDRSYDDVLISLSGEDDDTFLKTGHGLYY